MRRCFPKHPVQLRVVYTASKAFFKKLMRGGSKAFSPWPFNAFFRFLTLKVQHALVMLGDHIDQIAKVSGLDGLLAILVRLCRFAYIALFATYLLSVRSGLSWPS